MMEKKLKLMMAGAKSMKEFERDFGMNGEEVLRKLSDKEYVLSHVREDVTSAVRNADKLEGRMHVTFLGDLALSFRVMIGENEKGESSSTMTNEWAKRLGIGLEELTYAARNNTCKAGFAVMGIRDVLEDLSKQAETQTGTPLEMPEEFEIPMIVLTNTKRVRGANVLLHEDVFEAVAERLNDDLYVIPSSIHEVLAIPVAENDPADLKEIVRQVNDNEVAENEILSYHVYKYERESGRITVAC